MRTGIVTGAFDLLHAGHIHFLNKAKEKCDELIVALHVDPSKERKEKNKPIESLVERQMKLRGCKFVIDVITYETEEDLSLIFDMLDIDVRFLGSDYMNWLQAEKKSITNKDAIPIEYIDSIDIHTSNLRERIKKS